MDMQMMNNEKMCRCCLTNSGKLFSIYDKTKANECLTYMLDQITAVEPKLDDRPPNKACTLCIADIHDLYNFKLKCEKSNKMLQQLFFYKPIYFNVDVQPMNIDEICRCCLTNNGKLFSICDGGNDTEEGGLAYMIDQMSSVEIKLENKLPDKVCILCFSDIKRFCKFKLKCKESNKMLQQMFCYKAKVYSGSPLHILKMNKICQDGAKSLPYQISKDTSTSKNEVASFITRRESDLFSNCSSYSNYTPTSETDSANDSIILENEIHEYNDDNDDTIDVLPYRCAVCKEDLLNNQNLTSHLDFHEKPYSCTCCNDVFNDYSALSQHILEYTAKTKRKSSSTSRKQKQKKSYACKQCPKRFCSSRKLENHSRIHTGEIHEGIHTVKKPFKCRYCDTSFAREAAQVIHERTHTGERPFKCSHCDKMFATVSTQKIHERTHTGEKPFKCSYCDKMFPRAGTQKIHERTHTGEKPFKCNYCDRTFSRADSQKIHERTHTGEKPFKCRYCDKHFMRESGRIRHERTHTGEKPFNCRYCDKSFSIVDNQKIHERTHTGEKPFKCSYCERSFIQKSKQINHERTHTGEKPFKCRFCNKGFSRADSQLIHERIHTSEK